MAQHFIPARPVLYLTLTGSCLTDPEGLAALYYDTISVVLEQNKKGEHG
jgi:hypothetical protein